MLLGETVVNKRDKISTFVKRWSEDPGLVLNPGWTSESPEKLFKKYQNLFPRISKVGPRNPYALKAPPRDSKIQS